MTVPTGPERATIRSVQLLRFVAAAMVLIGHLQDALRRGRIPGLAPFDDPTGLPWHAGVDIFFVISGFVMYMMAADQFGRPGAPAAFMRRRLIRVAPLYWVFTLLAILTVVVLPERVQSTQLSLPHILASLLFVPWRAPSGALVPPLSVGWTLNFEILFYSVFAFGLLFRRAIGLAAIVGILFALMIPRALFPGVVGDQLDAWGFPITVEFLFGILIGRLCLANFRMPGIVRAAIVVGALAALSIGNQAGFNAFQDRWFFWGIPAAAIVAATVLGRDLPDRSWSRILVLCGNASYALYLSHLFTLRAVGVAWSALHLNSVAAYFALAMASSILASIAVYLWFERPMLAWLGRRPPTRSVRASALAAAPRGLGGSK
ncbi:acyltransferase family protein [Rhodopseudomonas telluris]|uniref:Acyltransferase family protein n=1 Tax=Rhodopseudomonas telluris TaxID=644215 RepID=A0ABV6EVX1_9BRAD